MTLIPTCPRVASCSPPSSTLRAGSADGLRPCLTATARVAWEKSGRDEETGPLSAEQRNMGWRQASETTGVQFLVSSGGQIRMSVDSYTVYCLSDEPQT
jgi:hypothetical protein